LQPVVKEVQALQLQKLSYCCWQRCEFVIAQVEQLHPSAA
jgi:hypothetical protein